MNSNNQMIQKGKISSVEGKADRNGDKTTARVLPSTADSTIIRIGDNFFFHIFFSKKDTAKSIINIIIDPLEKTILTI